ncbi:M20/M25/M40 family metallo-hydrolase [Brevundimonas sp.]|jgi:Zn-dependent M28 family amino/carboxypeptidase|uniref:M20/M25/M40 family metallo-hydrolase n=1 Tax=Brevundimonas sp. TaxID=1871086 RepID=UPI0037838639
MPRPNTAAIAGLTLAALLGLAGCDTVGLSPEATPAPAAPPPVQPVPEQLMTDVRVLSADDMEGRDTGSPGGERARAYIVSRLEAIGIAAPPMGRLQPFAAEVPTRSGPTRYAGTNILGLIPGTRVPDRYIVISAHYDHVGTRDGLIYNGADDNASGVATMLEIATQLKAQPPEHSVIIVAFDGEERGLIGAKHFVQAPPVPLASIALNLNFDMTARAETDGHLWVTGTYQHPTLRPMLEPVPAVGPVSLAFGKDTPQDTGANNWVEASDHGAFFKAGIPFLYLGVDYHPDYHRPSDDFERITPSVFASATEVAVSAFRALDQGMDR